MSTNTQDNNGLRAAHDFFAEHSQWLAGNWSMSPEGRDYKVAFDRHVAALAATQQPAPSAPEQPSAQAVRNVQGAAKMVANMLERDGTPVRVEAAGELLKVVGELAGLAEQPSAAVEAVGEAQLAGAIGFTCAYFKRTDVPEGTKLFTAQPEPLLVGALTDERRLAIWRDTVQGDTLKVTRDGGLNEVTELTPQARRLFQAIEREVLATQPTSAAAGTFVIPREVVELMADIDIEDHHDDNGPGRIHCPACGESARMRWHNGQRLDTHTDVPHNVHCPAQWAKAQRTTTPGGKKL